MARLCVGGEGQEWEDIYRIEEMNLQSEMCHN